MEGSTRFVFRSSLRESLSYSRTKKQAEIYLELIDNAIAKSFEPEINHRFRTRSAALNSGEKGNSRGRGKKLEERR